MPATPSTGYGHDAVVPQTEHGMPYGRPDSAAPRCWWVGPQAGTAVALPSSRIGRYARRRTDTLQFCCQTRGASGEHRFDIDNTNRDRAHRAGAHGLEPTMKSHATSRSWSFALLVPATALVAASLGCVASADMDEGAEEDAATASRPIVVGPISPRLIAPPRVSLSDAFLHNHLRRAHTDFNGDGHTDLAVAGSGAAVSVFMGTSSGLPSSPTMTISGSSGRGFFGLSNAGDVNGDGYDDLIVGDNADNAAYVYHGSANGLARTPSEEIPAPSGALAFGYGTMGRADFNHDGYDDVVISAPGTNSASGKVFIYYGSADGLASEPAITLDGTGGMNENFGRAMAVGFLNNDEHVDIIIGEDQNSFSMPQTGRVYVFMGTASGGVDTTPAIVLTCPDGPRKGFGASVSLVNDFDGDKIRDVVVGAYGVDGYDGRVYLFRGTSTGVESTPAVTFSPKAGTKGFFGWEVLGADLNLDLYGDVVIAETDANGEKGQVHVFYGGPLPFSPSDANHQVLAGTHSTAGYFGQGLAIARPSGKLSDDLVVGAPAADGNKGRVYLFESTNGGLLTTPKTTLLGTPGSQLGFDFAR